jgi:hypothetical protein
MGIVYAAWLQVRSMIWAGRPINIPVILAGWWHAGGLMLNYEAWKEKEPVDGYIFYSPSFGYAQDEPIYLHIGYFSLKWVHNFGHCVLFWVFEEPKYDVYCLRWRGTVLYAGKDKSNLFSTMYKLHWYILWFL